MSNDIIENLVETRKRVLLQVNQGMLSVSLGAQILGISRQGLWKLRKKVNRYRLTTMVGRKQGPRSYARIWNRTPSWTEEKVEDLFTTHGVGPDRLVWLLEDCAIDLSRATVYRILFRRRLFVPKKREKRESVTLYTRGYP